jgi:hypothetical protein
MPTPAAALLSVAPLIIFSQSVADASDWARFWGVLSFAIMIAAAVLMNLYPIRYLHLGRFMSRHPWFARITSVLLIAVFTPFFGHGAFLYMLLYTLSPLVTWRVDPHEAAKETRSHPAGAH